MNKMIKQLLAVTIIICVGMNTVHVEAKSKKVIMQVGDTKKVSCLKANKKYIFSKKKIVKINKKGKIVALKKGKTKIYCGNKKICDVTVKNAYFVCDLKQANKVVVTNLNHGNTFELEKDDIVALQNKINGNRFYRIFKDKNKKKGEYDYSFCAYNDEKLIFKVVVGNNKLKYYVSPEQTEDGLYYYSSKDIDFSEFE